MSTREGENPAYQANGVDRCFHCKDELVQPDRRRGSPTITGSTRWRTARTPTTPCGSTGRAPGRPSSTASCARWPTCGCASPTYGGSPGPWNCPCADKPAAPCLASRIPHFEPVTPEKLAPDRPRRGGPRRPRPARVPGAPPRRPGADRASVRRAELGAPRSVARPGGSRRAGRRIRRRDDRPGRPAVGPIHPDGVAGAACLTSCGQRDDPLTQIAELDLARTARRGYPEAVYCAHKSTEQVAAIAAALRERTDIVSLFTRATPRAGEGGAARATRGLLRCRGGSPGLAVRAAGTDRWPGRRTDRRHLGSAGGAGGDADRPLSRSADRTRRRRGRRRAAPSPRADCRCCAGLG